MFIHELPIVMIRCLIITIVIEVIIAIIIGIHNKKDIFNVILVNIVTNPLVVSISVYFNYRYGLTPRNICLIFFEIFALLFEGFIYDKYLTYKKMNGFLVSIILNGSSYFIGELINYIMYSIK